MATHSIYFIVKLAAFAATSSLATVAAHPATFDLVFDTNVESKTLHDTVSPGSTISLAGLFGPGSVSESLNFAWGAASPFSLSAAWRVGALMDSTPRLVGVNIDLLDNSNTVVASDIFTGLTSEFARSTMAIGNLDAGNYTLALTGTAVRDGIFAVDIAASATLPALPAPAIDPPHSDLFVYDTLGGTKQIGNPFASGGNFRIDGDIAELGALTNETAFVLTGNALSASVRWAVDAVMGSDPRLVGVNVDLLNSLNLVVASDLFGGVADGQGTSTLVATGLTPGSYRLLMTGNSVRGAQYQIGLSGSATPPVLPPIGVPVPEPATWAMMIAGFALAGFGLRRRNVAVGFAQV